jgi:hypothetical protein
MYVQNKRSIIINAELDWLQHKIKVSKVYEYRLRSDIKKKLGTFRQLELPLLMALFLLMMV